MKDLTAFSAGEVKKAAAEKKKKMSISLNKDNDSKSKRQSEFNNLLKIEGRETFVGAKDRRKRDSW